MSATPRALLLIWAASLALTGVSVGAPGRNNELHLALIRTLNDPGLYPGDPFAATLGGYASLVWPIVALPARWVEPQWVLLPLAILERLLVLWAAGRLARALAPGNDLAVIGAWVLFAGAPRPLVGAGTIVTGEFEQTGLAVALLMLASAALLEGRPWSWAIWMGLGASCNVIYAVHAVSYAAALFVADRRWRDGWRRWLGAGLGVAALAAPVAAPALRSGAVTAADPDLWMRALAEYFPYHHFPASWSASEIAALGLLGCAVIGATGACRRAHPDYFRYAVATGAVCLAWLAIAVASVALVVPVAMMLHPARATDLWHCHAALILIALCARRAEEAERRRHDGAARAWAAAFVLAVATQVTMLRSLESAALAGPLLVAAALAVVVARARRRTDAPIGPARMAAVTCVTTLAICVVLAAGVRIAGPRALVARFDHLGVGNYRPYDWLGLPDPAMADVAAWAREHTSRDAVFLVDPGWGGFRGLSLRPSFVTWKEGAAMLWRRDFAREWVDRSVALGVDPAALGAGPWTAAGRLRAAYRRLDAAGVERLRRRYRIDYWVIPRDGAGDAPRGAAGRVRHRNDRVEVLDLR